MLLLMLMILFAVVAGAETGQNRQNFATGFSAFSTMH